MNEKKLLLNNIRRERLKYIRSYLRLSQSEMGMKCGMKGPDIKNRENGVVEIKQIFADALEKYLNVSSEWLMTGQGEMMVTKNNHIAECNAVYQQNSNNPPVVRISDPLIQKTAAILESQTVYSTALKSNIEAFHYAMTCEEKLAASNKRIDDLEEHIKMIEKRLPAIINGS